MKKRELQRRNTDRRNFDDRRDGNVPVEKDKRSESGRRKIDDRRSGADRRDPEGSRGAVERRREPEVCFGGAGGVSVSQRAAAGAWRLAARLGWCLAP